MVSEQPLKLYHCLPIPRGNRNDIFDLQALRMVLIHNVIIRGYNAMLYYASEVTPGTKGFASYLRYCDLMNKYVHHHHYLEEKLWFPVLEEKLGEGCMKHNIDGHHAFMTKFNEFETRVTSLQTDSTTFDVQTFRDGIHAFMADLTEHLRDEPNSFRPEILRQHMTEADLIASDKAMEEEVMKTPKLVENIPLFFVNGDGNHGSWFPALPGPITFIAKYLFWYKHSDMWVFGPCDREKKVKPPFAAYEPDLEPELAAADAE